MPSGYLYHDWHQILIYYQKDPENQKHIMFSIVYVLYYHSCQVTSDFVRMKWTTAFGSSFV